MAKRDYYPGSRPSSLRGRRSTMGVIMSKRDYYEVLDVGKHVSVILTKYRTFAIIPVSAPRPRGNTRRVFLLSGRQHGRPR